MIIKYRRKGRTYWKVGSLLVLDMGLALELAFGAA